MQLPKPQIGLLGSKSAKSSRIKDSFYSINIVKQWICSCEMIDYYISSYL